MLGTDYNGKFQALFSSTSQVQVPIEIIHGHEPLPDERTGSTLISMPLNYS